MVEEVNNNVVPVAVAKPAVVAKPVIAAPVKPVVPAKPLPVAASPSAPAKPIAPQYSNPTAPVGNSVKRWALIVVVVVVVIVILSLGFFLLRAVIPSGDATPDNTVAPSNPGSSLAPAAPVAGPVTGEIVSLDCSSLPLKVEVKITSGSAEGILFTSTAGSEEYTLASMGRLNSGTSKNVNVQIIAPENVTVVAGDIQSVEASAIQVGGVTTVLDSANCAAQ